MTAYRHYYIPQHVYFAVENDTAVFLDLRSDQYSMLIGDDARTFSTLLARSARSRDRTITVDPAELERDKSENHVLADLLNNGILAPGRNTHASPVAAYIPLALSNLLDYYETALPPIRLLDIWRFLCAAGIAKWRLTCTSIESTVRAVEQRNISGPIEHPRTDLYTARRLVQLYKRLRPLLPRDFLCLYDSLSLLEFLARYRCFPNWVFAVQLEPWSAHCWVQCGTVTFNEDAAEARTYLPLLIV